MAFPTKENSGLVVEVDEKGRQRLLVHGNEVMGITKVEHVTGGDVDRGIGGIITVTILARFITFRDREKEPTNG